MIVVVVDEGIWMIALDGEVDPRRVEPPPNPAGDPAAAAALLYRLQTIAVWILSDEINTIYWNRLYGARYKGTLWNRLRDSLLGVLTDSERTVWLDEWQVVDGEYDHDDDRWVGAAAAVGRACILVTADRRLVAALTECNIPERHDFVVMDVVAAHREWAQE